MPSLKVETGRNETTSQLHGQTVLDPYRWLENTDSEEVKSWVDAQSRLSRASLDALPTQREYRDRLEELLYRSSLSAPIQRGGRLFFLRRNQNQEKATLFVLDANGQERPLVDPQALSPDGTTALGSWYPSPDGQFLAYAVRENNADESTLHVRCVDTGEDLPLDVIPGAKYASASWTPDAAGFYYEWLPLDSSIPPAERPGHTQLRFHELNTAPDRDLAVYPATGNPECFLGGNLSRDGRWLVVSVQHGWNRTDVYLRDLHAGPESPFIELVHGIDATFEVTWWEGYFYVLTNHQAPRYRVLRIDPNHLALDEWEELIEQGENSIESVQLVGAFLAVGSLHNATSRVCLHSLDGVARHEISLPELGTASAVYGAPAEDTAYFSFSTFTRPTRVFRLDLASEQPGAPRPWQDDPQPLRSTPLVVQQEWCSSKDGTRIPLFLIHKPNIELNGENPTLLAGYGGFNVSLSPVFSPLAVAWVDGGGVYALANLRGGGEYGEDWHRAGMRANKQNVFDDFAAAAEFLIQSGITNRKRLGIYGGSNGGLLVGTAMTQRPELFKAVVCAVPLLDMLRYHLFGSGKTWIGEYGSAEDPEQFEWLRAYSPYHHLRPEVDYPSLLMMAADSDDRVDPLHARKFTAALQWCQQQSDSERDPVPALFRLERNAGHGGADKVKERVASCTDICAFLWDQLAGSSAPSAGVQGSRKAKPA